MVCCLVLVTFLITVTKYLGRNNVMEEEAIFGASLRKRSSSQAEKAWPQEGKKTGELVHGHERGQEKGSRAGIQSLKTHPTVIQSPQQSSTS